MLVFLLNIFSYAGAQISPDDSLFNAKVVRPGDVTITGENIQIYRWDNIKSTDNYSMKSYQDSVHFRINDMPMEIKPKTGEWYKPFCAYPMSEESVIKGSFIPNFNSKGPIRQSEGIVMIKFNGVSREYRLLTTPGKKSTTSSGCIFNCKRLPGILIFGDLADPKNQFIVTFK
ncbi:MAG: hypothetical protein WDM78_16135 [Puia sp.]